MQMDRYVHVYTDPCQTEFFFNEPSKILLSHSCHVTSFSTDKGMICVLGGDRGLVPVSKGKRVCHNVLALLTCGATLRNLGSRGGKCGAIY